MSKLLSHGLARAFLDGDWTFVGLLRRGQQALGMNPHWLKPLVRRVLTSFIHPPLGTDRKLVLYIDQDRRLATALDRSAATTHIEHWFSPSRIMLLVPGRPANFSIPPIASEAQLASMLGVTHSELDWFADNSRLNAATTEGRLQHYVFRYIDKRSGGSRLLETPKARIKAMQRQILREILQAIPPHHNAHGFVAGRSAISFARVHSKARLVLRFDLVDFFVAIGQARITNLLLRVGYPTSVAGKLSGLCCIPTPAAVVAAYPRIGNRARRFEAMQRLRRSHLPQGAPTSPALSNLAAFPLDLRLSALARTAGGRYSRYADDLAFSGDRGFERSVDRFMVQVGAIVLEEGFRLNYRKTRVMRAGQRQQLCGLTINQRPNVSRRDYDRLRSILYNAARAGPQAQNRHDHPDFSAHLLGRIGWVAASNPVRGLKLRALYDQIVW